MANYDLTYEGSRVQSILGTGNELRDAGYIFRGEATPSTVPGTPTERVAYIGGPGTYTNFGSSITVGDGCICVFKYTGSAWSNQVINTGLDSAVNTLQSAITAINNNIDNGYVYAGVATPSTSPVTGKVFYLAVQAGTYTNFGNAVVTAGLNVIKYNGSAWSVDQVIAIDAEPTQGSANLVKSGGVLGSIIQNGPAFDLSAYNAVGGTLATYADLSAALTALNALPADFKKGGMSFKFVLTSDNKYVKFFCTADEFTTDVTKWQGVDDVPTAGSNNLVKSGGVFKSFRSIGVTESQISEFNKVVLSGGGGTNNRVAYWFILPISGSGEIVVYSANRRVVLSAGLDYSRNTYDGNEVATEWMTVTPSTPATIRFTNACYVCIKGDINEEQEESFLESLSFRIVWYNTKAFSLNSVGRNKLTFPTNAAVYFNNGKIPTISYNDTDITVSIIGNSQYKATQYLYAISQLFDGVRTENIDMPVGTYTIPNASALFLDTTKPIYDDNNLPNSERLIVASRTTNNDNYIMLLGNNGGIATGVFSVFAPNKNNIDISKINGSARLIEKELTNINFNKSEVFYGSIQRDTGNVASSNDRLTIPKITVVPNSIIQLPTSITKNGTTYEVRVRVVGFDVDNNSIRDIDDTNNYVVRSQITIPNNCYYVQISFGYNNNGYITKPNLLDNYSDGDFYVKFKGTYNIPIDVKQLRKDVDSLIGNNIVNQNTQRKIEATAMIRTYNSSSLSKNSKNFSCLFFSDVHKDSVAVDRIIQLSNAWGDALIDCVINGGDTVAQNILERVDWYNDLIIDSDIPVLTTMGNHDCWTSQDPQTMATPSQVYPEFFPTMVEQANIVQPSGAEENNLMYYYKDFINRGIRVIVLDCMFWDSTQNTWMQNVLSDAITQNLAVVCVVHTTMPASDTTPENVTFMSFLGQYSDSLSRNNAAMAANIKTFIDNDGEFVCWLMGHTHRDEFVTITDTNIYGHQACVVISSARGTADYPQVFDKDTVRNQDDYTRDHVDFFAVDKELGIFKIMRIGINTDLEMRPKNFLTYDYRNHAVLSNS